MTLLSSQPSNMQAALHPLVVLNITDYITRHTLRQQPGPLVGGLIGQHNGREITIEHGFDALTVPDKTVDCGGWRLDSEWFLQRLEQMRAVHKDRNLDLVGWFTLLSPTGPAPNILAMHRQILEINESAVLLGFVPADLLGQKAGGRLPISIYESNFETDDVEDEDTTMGEEGSQHDQAVSQMRLRFRQIPYSVETGEAEIISLSHVARGGANASAQVTTKVKDTAPSPVLTAQDSSPGKNTPVPVDGSRKRRAIEYILGSSNRNKSPPKANPSSPPKTEQNRDKPVRIRLNDEEEDAIAALHTKANAVRMLQSRINLMSTYLDAASAQELPVSPEIMRQMQALATRLHLVMPDASLLDAELARETRDVQLISELSRSIDSIAVAHRVGKLYNVVEHAINPLAKKARAAQRMRGGQHDSITGLVDGADLYAPPPPKQADDAHARLSATGYL